MMQFQETPRTGRILFGFAVDGTRIYSPVTLNPHQEVCTECEGQGTVQYDYGNDGFQRLRTETCEGCNGNGTIRTEPEEIEE